MHSPAEAMVRIGVEMEHQSQKLDSHCRWHLKTAAGEFLTQMRRDRAAKRATRNPSRDVAPVGKRMNLAI